MADEIMLDVSWTETFKVKASRARLIDLFDEHVPGKVSELLCEYLADNAPSDADLWPILRALREDTMSNGDDPTTDVNDVAASEA